MKKNSIDELFVNDERIKTVKDYINNELREYAVYDNIRSIPSVVDGLKITQRKVIYAVFEDLKPMAEIKTSQLALSASKLTHYRHNEKSITDTVVLLAKDYAGSNNYPLLLKEGQFGTVIDNENSSPRYISVRRYDKTDAMFDKSDRDIVKYLTYDGDKIEPEFYLPKLPLVVINGSSGIGNGYASKIALRDTKKVAQYVYDKINTGVADKSLLIPSYNGFNGVVEEVGDKKYLFKGTIERVNTTTTIITDLPPTSSYQYEKYKEDVLLKLLIDNKSGLSDIMNESSEGEWKIILKHTREFASCTDDELLEKLKMTESFTENLTVWGFDNRLKVFESVSELVDYWIEHRMEWIKTRKKYNISVMDSKSAWQRSLLALIEYWLVNDDLPKLKKPVLIERLKTVIENEEHINKFLDQNIMSLTSERVEKLRKEIKEINATRKKYLAKSEKEIFSEDISAFM